MLGKLRLVAFGTAVALSLTMQPAQPMQAAAAGIGPPAALTSQSSSIKSLIKNASGTSTGTVPVLSGANAGSITEFPIPNSNSGIVDIAAGADGNLWFAGSAGNRIGRITTGGTVSEFPIPTADYPAGITAGPDGNLWFTGQNIARITPTGAITEFPFLGGQFHFALDIVAGPDGNLWFTDQAANEIGRITTSGSVTEFSISTANSQPFGIAAGPDGNLWFTEQGVNQIGRITTGGSITEFPIPTPNSGLNAGIAAGPDGNVWFTEQQAHQIGRITTAGAVTEFSTPGGPNYPFDITTGPDGNLWFAAPSGIGQITTAGLVTIFNTQSQPSSIAAGPDGNLWFTDSYFNLIGKIATTGTSTLFRISGQPGSIAAGSDGNLWFTETAGEIGRMTTGGAISEFVIPTANSILNGLPEQITSGPDGNLWFIEANFKVGRITTTGTITEFPTPNAFLSAITTGPDSNLWFADQSGAIGRITTAGVVTEFPIPTANSNTYGITTGPDGNLWFTESGGNKIGRITTAGAITEFVIPSANGDPFGITSGPDGNLWFTEPGGQSGGNKIGRITTAGAITEFPIPTVYSVSPTGIVAGHDGNLWFTERGSDQIGLITTSGAITQFTVPTNSSGPLGITTGPDGNLWFTEHDSNQIGQLTPPNTSTSLASAPNPSVVGQTITFTAIVSSTTGQATPAGTVSLLDGAKTLATGTLDSSGTVQFTVSTLAAGTHTLTASYAGGGSATPSVSAPLTQVVQSPTSVNTATTLTSAPNPSLVGQTVTFTAIVSSTTGQATPGGTVSLLDGPTTLATGTLDSSGTVQFAVSNLAAGTHILTASYAGGGSATPSVSAPLTQVVKSPTSVVMASSVNPSVAGQSVTFAATVTPIGPSSSMPSGSVTFDDGTTPLGSGTLDGNGRATFSIAALSMGSHSIKAAYLGDNNFGASTSGALTQTVNPSLKLVVTSAPVTLTAGASGGLITVQLQDQSSTPVLAPSGGLSLILNAASPTASFRDAGDTIAISTAVIAGGSNSVQFRYRDTFAGTVTITISTQTPAAATSAAQGETVIPASLDHLGLGPATSTVAPGGTKIYKAEGFDIYGNDIGDVTSATHFSVGPDGSCTGAMCTIPTSGTHTVTGTDGTVTGTATLIGDAGPIPTLTVTNGSGMASHTVTFNIGGTDADGDPLTYSISYGDGTTASGSLPSAPLSHTYTAACPLCTVVLSVSDGITQPAPYTVATVDIAPNQTLVANPGDPPTITLGQAAHLDGSNSSPAPPGIESYTWNFGDGTSASGAVQDHVYPGPAPKTWTATLTITGGGASASATVNVNVLPAPTLSGLAIHVTGDGSPLAGASVVVEDAKNNIFNAVDKGSGVYNISGLPDGSYTVFGYKSGFGPNTASATISGGSGTTTLALASGAVATTSLTATRLTAAQAAALGIDTTAPGNQNVYQFELHLDFGRGGLVAISGVASGNGFYAIGGGVGVGPGGAACSLLCTTIVASVGGFTIIGNVAEISGDNPSIIWMIVPGKAQWLKELFDVRILVTNLAPTPFTLSNGSATLNLPAGLSLAELKPGLPAQQLTKPIGDIPGQTSQGTDWLIRGDAEGLYQLSADYRAVLSPIGAPIRLHAQTVNPIHIWGASALRMTFDADDVAYAAYPYHIRVSLTNVADVPVFNPLVELMPREGDPSRNYVFQPREQYDQGTDQILPGGTFETRDYIVVPNFTGTLDVSSSFIAPIGGNVSALTAVITSHRAAAPSSYPTDNALIESNGVAVGWQAVTGAQGYQVFATSDYPQDFPFSFVAQVGGTQTNVLLPSGSYGLVAVSTLLVGSDGHLHNVLGHPLIRPQNQPVGSPQSVHVDWGNGTAHITWTIPTVGSAAVTGYVITARPVTSDRSPAPPVGAVTINCPADKRCAGSSASINGLLADCHQRYDISVSAVAGTSSGVAQSADNSPGRPSGHVAQGVPPQTVVILLDGIAEWKPPFLMNPYQPTFDSPTYCPETWSDSVASDAPSRFLPAPVGPSEFFSKWNFSDPIGPTTLDATPCWLNAPGISPSPAKCSNSTPRDLQTGGLTHTFMLDAIAAQGAIILPYSYKGAVLLGPSTSPIFAFPGYSMCDSTPNPVPIPFNSPPCDQSQRGSIADYVNALNREVMSIHNVWKSSKIVILGHSQGGLVGWGWWMGHPLSRLTGVVNVFTLDSPINGCDTPLPCVDGYPIYQSRWSQDTLPVKLDAALHNPVRFVGTEGDTVPILPFGLLGGYGPSGPQNLQSELLVTGNNCTADPVDQLDCPAPTDHISGCDIDLDGQFASTSWIQDDQHFIVKFCPDVVDYINHTLLGDRLLQADLPTIALPPPGIHVDDPIPTTRPIGAFVDPSNTTGTTSGYRVTVTFGSTSQDGRIAAATNAQPCPASLNQPTNAACFLIYPTTSYMPPSAGSQVMSVDVAANNSNGSASGVYKVLDASYRIDVKAWIPFPIVVDPEDPLVLSPASIAVDALGWPTCGAPHRRLIALGSIAISDLAGDTHVGFAGGFRVDEVVTFTWNGTTISNFQTTIDQSASIRDIVYSDGQSVWTCTMRARGTPTSTSVVLSPTSFNIDYSGSTPLVPLAPQLHGLVQGTFSLDGTIDFTFDTTGFPSHGIEIARDGAIQQVDLLNDVSCIGQDGVLGAAGLSNVTRGLTGLANSVGAFTDTPNQRGVGGFDAISGLC